MAVNDEYEGATRHTIKRGMTQIEAVVYPDDTVEVTRQKLMHHFDRGYSPRGPKRTIYEGKAKDAVYVADVLNEVFSSER